MQIKPEETSFKSFDEYFEDNFYVNYKPINRIINFPDSSIKNGNYRNFEEAEKLGEGSYGEVFKVKKNNELFAVKKIKFTNDIESDLLKALKIFHTIKKLTNDSVIRYFEAWVEVEVRSLTLHIRMELCDSTLQNVINEINSEKILKVNNSLTILGYYIASKIFIEILRGVDYLHQQNPQIIHRDLKPDNILLKKIKSITCVKIADFGLIAFHEIAERSQYHSGDKGHRKYAAPEVLYCKKYNTKADIYSMAVIAEDLFSVNLDE
jgi:serine/threonine protein kinase